MAGADELTLAINTVWVILAAVLVAWMHAGFTVLEAGFTRAKNTTNILMKNSYTITMGLLIYYLLGFGLMFGTTVGGLVGSSHFLMANIEAFDGTVPGSVLWVFQAMFAATAATIVSGAVAERTHFAAYALFVLFITGLIYPVVGHWVWGGGWLGQLGFHDFAGSTVVHSVGAWCALVAAAMVGSRLGKYVQGQARAIPGHSMPLGALGVLILFMGWFGFNGGSTLAAVGADLGLVVVNTALAASAGLVLAMLESVRRYGKADLTLSLNGLLAGLVGITAGADAVAPLAALVIGALAGALLVASVAFIDQRLRVDDPVGAISVHGVCGVLGTLMVGVFAMDGGLLYSGGLRLLGLQGLGVMAVALFSMAAAFLTLRLVSWIVPLRVSAQEESDGLDMHEHGTPAYVGLTGEAVVSPSTASGD